MRRLLDKAAVIGVALVASGALAGAAAASARTPHHQAASSGTSWTQHTVCPGSGMTVDLVASDVVTSSASGGAQHVTGKLVATSSAGHSADVALNYTVTSQAPGVSVVTGTAVELVAGGGAMVVRGTAYLAPDGFLGRFTGTTTALCSSLAA
jgi:hypothetical protein